MVNVQIATAVAGAETGEGKSYPVVLGAGQAIAPIEELIMEAAPGQTIERPVKWPDDFPDEAQRGQTKTVRVTVNEVKRKSVPPMDDAFAREVGDFESLDALKQAVRTDLERHAEHEIEAGVRQQLIDQIISAMPSTFRRAGCSSSFRTTRKRTRFPPTSVNSSRASSDRWPSGRSGATS